MRRPARSDHEVTWDPTTGTLDPAALAGVEAVHLSGAGLGDRRWTESYKRELRTNRVTSTTTLATALAALDPLPCFVSASAIGYYGDAGDTPLDEDSPRGEGFLAELVEDWERCRPRPTRGHPGRAPADRARRLGPGGTWGRLIPLFRLGLGGPLGDGTQYWSFVSIEDEVRALVRMITDDSLDGPVNLTAPNPLTNAEVTHAMGRALHRPTLLRVPGFALRACWASSPTTCSAASVSCRASCSTRASPSSSRPSTTRSPPPSPATPSRAQPPDRLDPPAAVRATQRHLPHRLATLRHPLDLGTRHRRQRVGRTTVDDVQHRALGTGRHDGDGADLVR